MLPFDHQLKIGSTTKGLKLVRQNGQVLYKVSDLITSSTENYQEEFRYTQDDWKGGHGKLNYDPYEPDRFYSGATIDTTSDGRIILAPKAITTAADANILGFKWFEATGELLCWTAAKIFRYITADTGIDTDEALDSTETGVDCDADASAAIPAWTHILVESEQMLVTSTGTALTVVRGIHGTTKATHVINQDIYKYGWTAATTAVTGVTGMAEHDGIMYAARGTANIYMYSADGDTWTATDLADNKAQGFLSARNADGTGNVLWKWKQPNEVTSTTDGRTAGAGGQAWSSIAYVGDTSDNITNMFVVGGRLMVGREDNLFHYDSDGSIEPLMEDLKLNRGPNNFKYVAIWKTSAYFSLEGNGMGELTTGNSYDFMGPVVEIDNIEVNGPVNGISASEDFLFVSVYVHQVVGISYVYKGRLANRYQGPRWEWCNWAATPASPSPTGDNPLLVVNHSAGDTRLWHPYNATPTFDAYCYDIYADPTQYDAIYNATGSLRMPYTKGTDPYWVKNIQSVITETEACAAGITVTPKYRKNTDSSATALTAAIITNGYVKTDATTEVSCNKISFELHLATNNALITPIVKYFQARGQEQPETIRMHDCTYSVEGGEFEDTQSLRDFLRTGTTATATIRFSDLNFTPAGTGGTENTDWVHVKMMGRPVEIPVYHEKDKMPELAVQVRFREVSF